MDRNEAAAALASVGKTQGRLAEVSEWPLWRHALFGLAEAVFIFGLSLTLFGTIAGLVVAAALTVWIFNDDKRRYGRVVSGWQGMKPKILLVALIAFVLSMAYLSWSARGQPIPAPGAVLAALATFAVCTLASLWWQHLYRAELREGAIG
ncbi:hypothetical protein [Aurantiacibacter aquimixticola]|nr:hypothetical protein [Aurantiacibacter aquimixticola]